jgi:hypothetical protein
MRAIIAASEPAEELVLANMHLVQLTASPSDRVETTPLHDAPPHPGAGSRPAAPRRARR